MRGGNHSLSRALEALLLAVLLMSGCASASPAPPASGSTTLDALPTLIPVTLASGERLRVVATTSIVADVVRTIAGDRVDVAELVPLGADPHDFQPTPQDAAAISNAHVVFINGAGLEQYMTRLLANAGGDIPVVPVSYGTTLLTLQGGGERR